MPNQVILMNDIKLLQVIRCMETCGSWWFGYSLKKLQVYLTINAMKVERWLEADIKLKNLLLFITLDVGHKQLIGTKDSAMNETYLLWIIYQMKQNIKKGIKQKPDNL